MLQEYEKFPNWLIDVEEGKIWSKTFKKFVCSQDKLGYVTIRNISKNKTYKIHRVIWECVNGEIPNGYHIHHIDGNKLNNSIYNLELLSTSEHHTLHNHNMSKERREKLSSYNIKTKSKTVLMLDKITEEIIAEFKSTREAARVLNYKSSGNIGSCCRGILNTCNGFKWKYKYEN